MLVRHVVAMLLLAALTAEDLPPAVYVPFKDTPTVTGERTILMPYDRFKALWEAAHPVVPVVEPGKPPVGAALTGYTLVGAVTGEVAELTLTGTVTALAAEWSVIELPAELAVSAFKPGDKRVVLERRPGSLRLLLPAAGRYEFTATVAAAVARDASGRRTLDLVLPGGSAGRIDLRLPVPDADVALTPQVAASAVPDGDGTRLLVVAGGAPRLGLGWRPPAPAATGEALLVAEGAVRLAVGDGALRYGAALNVDVLRRPVERLELDLPPGAQVLAVEARSLRTWERDGDRLVLQFHEPVTGKVPVTIRLERPLSPLAAGATRAEVVTWPAVRGASRVSLVVGIAGGDGVAVAVADHPGLRQVDPTEVGMPGDQAYRAAASPAPTTLVLTRLDPEVRASLDQLVRLGVDEDLGVVVLRLDVRKAGLFTVPLLLPSAWEVVDTSGLAVDEVRQEVATGPLRPVSLILRSRLIGDGQVIMRLRRAGSLPRDEAPALPALGLAVLPGVKQLRGTVVVAAPKSWALGSATRSGLSGAELEPLRREGPLAALLRELRPDEDAAQAWTWLGGEPSLSLSAAPRAREVAVQIEELVTVAEGQVRRHATVRSEVRYRPLPVLTLTVPSSLDAVVQFTGTTLAERSVVARADGVSTWELRFAAPVLGPVVVTVDAATPTEVPPAGASRQVAIAPLGVTGVTTMAVVVAVARDGALEVAASATGAEMIAPADLPGALMGAGVVAGFRAAASLPVLVTVTRHDLLPVADAAVSLAEYTAVVGTDGMARVRGVWTLTSRGRPYLDLGLPTGATLLASAVDGTEARPSRRADGSIVLPLGGTSGVKRVAVLYEVRAAAGDLGRWGGGSLGLPRLDGREGGTPMPVQAVRLALWLPAGLEIFGWRGDLVPESQGYSTGDDGGLGVPLAVSGTDHHLQRLGDGGTVAWRHLSRSLLGTLAAVVGLCALPVAWLLRRRRSALGGVLLAVAVSAVVVPWPLTVVAGCALLGLLIGTTTALGAGAVTWLRSRRSGSTDA